MHAKNRAMMIPLVLGVGFGKLPAQAQASTNKTTMEVVENFSVPSEIQTQVNESYDEIMTILEGASYENDEQLNQTILQVLGVLSEGANKFERDNAELSPQEKDEYVDLYYKAINYRLYGEMNDLLENIKTLLHEGDYGNAGISYDIALEKTGLNFREYKKNDHVTNMKDNKNRKKIKKLFEDIDPNILKLMKLEIKDAMQEFDESDTFNPWSTNNVREVDNLIRESYEIKQLLNEQIERLERNDSRESLPVKNLLLGFVLGTIITTMLLKFKTMTNVLNDLDFANHNTKPQPKKQLDDESTLKEMLQIELQQHHQEMRAWAEQQEDKMYTQAYECAMNLFNTGVAREAIYKGQKEIQVTGVTLKNGDDMYARRWDPVQIPAQLAHEWHEGDWNGGSAEDYKSQLKYNGYFFGTPRETPLFYKHTIDNKSDKLGRLLDVDVIQKGYTLPVLEMKDPDDSSTFSCDDLTIAKHFLPAELHKEKYIGFFLGVLARQPLWKWYLHPGELQPHEDKTYKTLQVKSGPRPYLYSNTVNQGRNAWDCHYYDMPFHPCRSGRSSISTHR